MRPKMLTGPAVTFLTLCCWSSVIWASPTTPVFRQTSPKSSPSSQEDIQGKKFLGRVSLLQQSLSEVRHDPEESFSSLNSEENYSDVHGNVHHKHIPPFSSDSRKPRQNVVQATLPLYVPEFEIEAPGQQPITPLQSKRPFTSTYAPLPFKQGLLFPKKPERITLDREASMLTGIPTINANLEPGYHPLYQSDWIMNNPWDRILYYRRYSSQPQQYYSPYPLINNYNSQPNSNFKEPQLSHYGYYEGNSYSTTSHPFLYYGVASNRQPITATEGSNFQQIEDSNGYHSREVGGHSTLQHVASYSEGPSSSTSLSLGNSYPNHYHNRVPSLTSQQQQSYQLHHGTIQVNNEISPADQGQKFSGVIQTEQNAILLERDNLTQASAQISAGKYNEQSSAKLPNIVQQHITQTTAFVNGGESVPQKLHENTEQLVTETHKINSTAIKNVETQILALESLVPMQIGISENQIAEKLSTGQIPQQSVDGSTSQTSSNGGYVRIPESNSITGSYQGNYHNFHSTAPIPLHQASETNEKLKNKITNPIMRLPNELSFTQTISSQTSEVTNSHPHISAPHESQSGTIENVGQLHGPLSMESVNSHSSSNGIHHQGEILSETQSMIIHSEAGSSTSDISGHAVVKPIAVIEGFSTFKNRSENLENIQSNILVKPALNTHTQQEGSQQGEVTVESSATTVAASVIEHQVESVKNTEHRIPETHKTHNTTTKNMEQQTSILENHAEHGISVSQIDERFGTGKVPQQNTPEVNPEITDTIHQSGIISLLETSQTTGNINHGGQFNKLDNHLSNQQLENQMIPTNIHHGEHMIDQSILTTSREGTVLEGGHSNTKPSSSFTIGSSTFSIETSNLIPQKLEGHNITFNNTQTVSQFQASTAPSIPIESSTSSSSPSFNDHVQQLNASSASTHQIGLSSKIHIGTSSQNHSQKLVSSQNELSAIGNVDIGVPAEMVDGQGGISVTSQNNANFGPSTHSTIDHSFKPEVEILIHSSMFQNAGYHSGHSEKQGPAGISMSTNHITSPNFVEISTTNSYTNQQHSQTSNQPHEHQTSFITDHKEAYIVKQTTDIPESHITALEENSAIPVQQQIKIQTHESIQSGVGGSSGYGGPQQNQHSFQSHFGEEVATQEHGPDIGLGQPSINMHQMTSIVTTTSANVTTVENSKSHESSGNILNSILELERNSSTYQPSPMVSLEHTIIQQSINPVSSESTNYEDNQTVLENVNSTQKIQITTNTQHSYYGSNLEQIEPNAVNRTSSIGSEKESITITQSDKSYRPQSLETNSYQGAELQESHTGTVNISGFEALSLVSELPEIQGETQNVSQLSSAQETSVVIKESMSSLEQKPITHFVSSSIHNTSKETGTGSNYLDIAQVSSGSENSQYSTSASSIGEFEGTPATHNLQAHTTTLTQHEGTLLVTESYPKPQITPSSIKTSDILAEAVAVGNQQSNIQSSESSVVHTGELTYASSMNSLPIRPLTHLNVEFGSTTTLSPVSSPSDHFAHNEMSQNIMVSGLTYQESLKRPEEFGIVGVSSGITKFPMPSSSTQQIINHQYNIETTHQASTTVMSGGGGGGNKIEEKENSAPNSSDKLNIQNLGSNTNNRLTSSISYSALQNNENAESKLYTSGSSDHFISSFAVEQANAGTVSPGPVIGSNNLANSAISGTTSSHSTPEFFGQSTGSTISMSAAHIVSSAPQQSTHVSSMNSVIVKPEAESLASIVSVSPTESSFTGHFAQQSNLINVGVSEHIAATATTGVSSIAIGVGGETAQNISTSGTATAGLESSKLATTANTETQGFLANSLHHPFIGTSVGQSSMINLEVPQLTTNKTVVTTESVQQTNSQIGLVGLENSSHVKIPAHNLAVNTVTGAEESFESTVQGITSVKPETQNSIQIASLNPTKFLSSGNSAQQNHLLQLYENSHIIGTTGDRVINSQGIVQGNAQFESSILAANSDSLISAKNLTEVGAGETSLSNESEGTAIIHHNQNYNTSNAGSSRPETHTTLLHLEAPSKIVSTSPSFEQSTGNFSNHINITQNQVTQTNVDTIQHQQTHSYQITHAHSIGGTKVTTTDTETQNTGQSVEQTGTPGLQISQLSGTHEILNNAFASSMSSDTVKPGIVNRPNFASTALPTVSHQTHEGVIPPIEINEQAHPNVVLGSTTGQSVQSIAQSLVTEIIKPEIHGAIHSSPEIINGLTQANTDKILHAETHHLGTTGSQVASSQINGKISTPSAHEAQILGINGITGIHIIENSVLTPVHPSIHTNNHEITVSQENQHSTVIQRPMANVPTPTSSSSTSILQNEESASPAVGTHHPSGMESSSLVSGESNVGVGTGSTVNSGVHYAEKNTVFEGPNISNSNFESTSATTHHTNIISTSPGMTTLHEFHSYNATSNSVFPASNLIETHEITQIGLEHQNSSETISSSSTHQNIGQLPENVHLTGATNVDVESFQNLEQGSAHISSSSHTNSINQEPITHTIQIGEVFQSSSSTPATISTSSGFTQQSEQHPLKIDMGVNHQASSTGDVSSGHVGTKLYLISDSKVHHSQNFAIDGNSGSLKINSNTFAAQQENSANLMNTGIDTNERKNSSTSIKIVHSTHNQTNHTGIEISSSGTHIAGFEHAVEGIASQHPGTLAPSTSTATSQVSIIEHQQSHVQQVKPSFEVPSKYPETILINSNKVHSTGSTSTIIDLPEFQASSFEIRSFNRIPRENLVMISAEYFIALLQQNKCDTIKRLIPLLRRPMSGIVLSNVDNED